MKDSKQTAEIWAKGLMIPAASMAKAVEALVWFAIRHWIFSLMEKARVQITPEPPWAKNPQVSMIVLHEG